MGGVTIAFVSICEFFERFGLSDVFKRRENGNLYL
jgi:hypothetical protein